LQPAIAGNLLEYLSQIPDPRGRQGRRFPLSAMLATIVCALLSGARGFESITAWIHAQDPSVWHRLGYFRRPPSANTFRNLLLALPSAQLEAIVRTWIAAVLPPRSEESASLEAVALDGKSLCGVLDEHGRTLHLLAVLDQQTGCVLTQMAVDGKTNEIPTAPELLATINLKQRVVTADAMHCQRETARQILDSGGHYLLVAEFQPAFSPGG
jgi:hypothetical protein